MSGDVIRIDRKTAWTDPVRAAVVHRERVEIPERERTVRLAINDPGAFTGRGYVENEDKNGGGEYESITGWQARAVLIALTDHLKD